MKCPTSLFFRRLTEQAIKLPMASPADYRCSTGVLLATSNLRLVQSEMSCDRILPESSFSCIHSSRRAHGMACTCGRLRHRLVVQPLSRASMIWLCLCADVTGKAATEHFRWYTARHTQAPSHQPSRCPVPGSEFRSRAGHGQHF